MSDWDDSPNGSPGWNSDFKEAANHLSQLLQQQQQQQSKDSYEQLAYKLTSDQFPEEIHIPGTNPPNPSLMHSSSGDEKCSYSSPRSKSPTSSASESRSSPLEMSPSSSEGSSTPVRRSSLSSESRTPPLMRVTSPSLNDAYASPSLNDAYTSPTFDQNSPLPNDSCNSPLPNEAYNSPLSNNSYNSPLSNDFTLQLSNDRFPIENEDMSSSLLNEKCTSPAQSPPFSPKSMSPLRPLTDSGTVESLLPKSPSSLSPAQNSPLPILSFERSPSPVTSPVTQLRKSPSPVATLSFPKSPLRTTSFTKSSSPTYSLPTIPLMLSRPLNEEDRKSYTPPIPPPFDKKLKSALLSDRQSYTPPLPCKEPQRESYTPPLPPLPPDNKASGNSPSFSKVLQSFGESDIIPPESISLPLEPPPALPPLPATISQAINLGFPKVIDSNPNTSPESIPLPSSPPRRSLFQSSTLISQNYNFCPSKPEPSTMPELKVDTSFVPSVISSPAVQNYAVPSSNNIVHNHVLEQTPPGNMVPPPGSFQQMQSPQVNHIGQPFMYYAPQQAPVHNPADGQISGMNHIGLLPSPAGQAPESNFRPVQQMPANFCQQNAPFPHMQENMDNNIPHKRMRENNPPRNPVNNGDFHFPTKHENQFVPQPAPVGNHSFQEEFSEDFLPPPNNHFFQNGNNGPPPPVPNGNGKNFPPRPSRPPLLRSPILRPPPEGHFPPQQAPFPPRPRRPPPATGPRPHHPPGPGQAPTNDNGRSAPHAPPGVPPDLWQWFLTADQDKDGYITARELQCILLNGSWSPFSEERCRMMVDMLDRERTGTINAYELTTIWNCLCEWKTCFEEFDIENFGHVNPDQLTLAFSKFGYNLSNEFSKVVIGHFENEIERKVTFDDFIHSCIMLKSLTDVFQLYDTNKAGTIDLHYEQFLEMVLDNIVGSPYHPV